MSLLLFVAGQRSAPDPQAEETRAPGGGYAPWEYNRLDRIRDRMEAERRAKDKATLDDLSEAYDRVTGLIKEAKQEQQAIERMASAQAPVSVAAPRARTIAPPKMPDFGALIAKLTELEQEIEQRIADEDEAISLLLMVA